MNTLRIGAVLLLFGAALVVATPAQADTTVCQDNLVNDGYRECFGYTPSGCQGSGTGVGHFYTWVGPGSPPAPGPSGGWCYVSISSQMGHAESVCTQSEFHVFDNCIHVL